MRAGRAIAAVAAVAATTAVPPIAAASDELSPRLARLASPQLQSAPPSRQARAVDLPPQGPGSLVRRGDRVVVEIRVAPGRVDALRPAGARVIGVHGRYGVVVAAVEPKDVRAVAAAPGVHGVTEALAPVVFGASTCQGSVVSAGDSILRADTVRSALGVDGTGVKVGILSDSFDHTGTAAEGDVASGDLPGACGSTPPVGILSDEDPGADVRDEGRAIAQVVHDLAPGASLTFARAGGPTEFEMASNIRSLARDGARVIVDDVIFLDEPTFQDGPLANAIADVTAQGVTYFSAAGNNNIRAGGTDVGSWESPAYRPAACPLGLDAQNGADCEDFGPGDTTYSLTVPDGGNVNVVLQWAEPWGGVKTDLNIALLVSNVERAESNEANVTGSQKPFEVLHWHNDLGTAVTADVVVARGSSPDPGTPRLKLIRFENGRQTVLPEPAYRSSSGGDIVGPTVFGHAGAAAASSVAAVPASDSSTVQPYSSRGPVTHYFGPVTGTQPAAPLASPRVIAKPDVAASDCVMTTFFRPSDHKFCGTSGSAPHAAAVAALQLDANPSLTPGQIRALQRASGRPVGTFGSPAVGGGLLDAVAAAPPAIVTVAGPRKLIRDRTPSFRLAASHVASFRCSIDGRAAVRCSARFTARRLRDGRHTFVAFAVDALGHTGRSAPYPFRIDATGPRTRITRHPRRHTRRHRVKFAFSSPERNAKFRCSVDGRRFKRCRSPRRVKVGRRGLHRFRVRAVDRLGNRGRVAKYRWRVVR